MLERHRTEACCKLLRSPELSKEWTNRSVENEGCPSSDVRLTELGRLWFAYLECGVALASADTRPSWPYSRTLACEDHDAGP